MEEKKSKRSYYLPPQLVKLFAEWSKPSRNYSPSVAGAILVWMSLDPEFRKKAEKMAFCDDITNQFEEMKRMIIMDHTNLWIQKNLAALKPADRIRLLADVAKLSNKVSDNP